MSAPIPTNESTRLRAARALGWGELRVRVLPIDVAATAALATLRETARVNTAGNAEAGMSQVPGETERIPLPERTRPA